MGVECQLFPPVKEINLQLYIVKFEIPGTKNVVFSLSSNLVYLSLAAYRDASHPLQIYITTEIKIHSSNVSRDNDTDTESISEKLS